MPTLHELTLKLAEVDQVLQATWLREREGARKRIAEMAVEFQLSPTTVANDIAAAQRKAPLVPAVFRPPTVDLPLRSDDTVQHVAAKYRDAATGDSWTGLGPRPRWLREALQAGAVLEDFQVDAGTTQPGDPLRELQDAARRARWKPKP